MPEAIGICPFCKHEVTELLALPTKSDKAIQKYYRRKAQGSRITLKQIAQEFGLNESYLRAAKSEYDKAGKWGSKKRKTLPDT